MERSETAVFAGPATLTDGRWRRLLTAADEGRGLVQSGLCRARHKPECWLKAKERAITWADIHRQGVGERALAMAKRPRERLILLLTIHLHMTPAEINKLNLPQVTRRLCVRRKEAA